jgi:hypothetical protein
MNFGQTVFSQLIEHLPHKDFQKCVARIAATVTERASPVGISFSPWLSLN